MKDERPVLTADVLAERTMHRRAIEAVSWGMPAVNFELMYQAMGRDAKAWSSRSSLSTGLQKNAEGSVDVFFGPKAPKGKDSNWVPTQPNKGFEVIFRFYGPQKALFEKSWRLPDIERVQ